MCPKLHPGLAVFALFLCRGMLHIYDVSLICQKLSFFLVIYFGVGGSSVCD